MNYIEILTSQQLGHCELCNKQSWALPYLCPHLRSSAPADHQTRCGGPKCGNFFKSAEVSGAERRYLKSVPPHLRFSRKKNENNKQSALCSITFGRLRGLCCKGYFPATWVTSLIQIYGPVQTILFVVRLNGSSSSMTTLRARIARTQGLGFLTSRRACPVAILYKTVYERNGHIIKTMSLRLSLLITAY